jgi:hypothetical protein
MSASTESPSPTDRASSPADPPPGRGPLAAVWRPAGALYLLFCLAGLACGLWPEAIYPSRSALRPAPLPTLQALAVGQVGFFLLAYPLVLMRRRRRAPGGRWLPDAAVESAGMLVAALPFYTAAAYLADAVAADVVRVATYLACLAPLSWAVGAQLAERRAVAGALLTVLVAAFGLPGAYYLAREFLGAAPGNWLWRAGPATFAWELSRARGGSWLPRPAWAVGLWPGVAAAAALVRLIPVGRRQAG